MIKNSFNPLKVLGLLILMQEGSAVAQEGVIDPAFNPVDDGLYGNGQGPNGTVSRILETQDDGYLIFHSGGQYNGQWTGRIFSVSNDGVLDQAYWLDDAIAGVVLDIQSSPQGGYFIGGSTGPIGYLAKLTEDGQLDPAFLPASYPNGTVTQIHPSPNGSLLVRGFFNMVGDSDRNGIACFAPDGSLSAFDIASSVNGLVRCATYQSDGSLILGGGSTSVQGHVIKRVARIAIDGTVDTTFSAAGGPNAEVTALGSGADGSLFISGSFTYYADIPRTRLAKLLPAGVLDLGFDPGTGPNWPPELLRTGADGSLLIANGFTSYQGSACDRMVVLNSDGSLRYVVGTGSGTCGTIYDILYRAGGRIVVGGAVNCWMGEQCRYAEALLPNAEIDLTFDPGTGANGYVGAVAVAADGRIYIGGEFTRYNGIVRRGLAVLHPDGTLDDEEGTGLGFNGVVRALSILPDGRYYVGGGFTRVQGVERKALARLGPNGLLDPEFMPGITGEAYCINVLQDGRILVGGTLSAYGGTSGVGLLRLHPDGQVDTTFNVGTGSDHWWVKQIATHSDGRIVVTGSFLNWNGTGRRNVVRLHPDGSVDEGFDPGTGTNGDVRGLALQADGKIVIGGMFTTLNGVERHYVARLEPSGAADVAFSNAVGSGSTQGVTSVALDAEGRVLVAGTFGFFDGLASRPIVRLLPTGTRDPDFYGSMISSGGIHAMGLQPDGGILIAGNFTDIDGIPRNRVARLAAEVVGIEHPNEPGYDPVCYPNPAHSQVTIQSDQPLGAVCIIDLQGREVYWERSNMERITLRTDRLPAGLYGVQVTNARYTRTLRLVIE